MIRVLTAEDNSQKEAAWSLFEEVYPDFESRVPFYSEYKEKVLSKALILYGEVDGSIKGVIAFYCNDSGSRTAYITQIAVKETSRRLGIGGILLGKCEEISLQKGMRYLRLEVRNDNANAIRFYQGHSLQFEKKASEKSMYMIKSL